MHHTGFDCTLYLVRHVRSAMNDQHDVIGGVSAFTPATKLGLKQGEALGQRLKTLGVDFDLVLRSQTKRTKTTADIICRNVGFDPSKVRVKKELAERDQGKWTGCDRNQMYSSENLAYMNLRVLDFAPPGGESLRGVGRRMLTCLEKEVLLNPACLEAAREHPLHIIVVTHGMALKAFLREILGYEADLTWRWEIGNASLTTMRFTERGWFPVCINDTGHLVGI